MLIASYIYILAKQRHPEQREGSPECGSMPISEMSHYLRHDVRFWEGPLIRLRLQAKCFLPDALLNNYRRRKGEQNE